jgi:hypothetical protein
MDTAQRGHAGSDRSAGDLIAGSMRAEGLGHPAHPGCFGALTELKVQLRRRDLQLEAS